MDDEGTLVALGTGGSSFPPEPVISKRYLFYKDYGRLKLSQLESFYKGATMVHRVVLCVLSVMGCFYSRRFDLREIPDRHISWVKIHDKNKGRNPQM